MNSPRRDALQVFMDVVEDGAYANLRLKEVRREPSELAYISSLVYTALEHLRWTDYMLSFYVKPQKKVVRNILRLGMTELFFMDTPDHAAVNGAVELTRECGKGALAGLVNGVLRRVLREKDSLPPLPSDPVERLSIQFGCPDWILREWL
ncbi:MAG: 16S rRNA (cytosine(967)-C(5))-methyltransferase, partial [Clostridia bacterium]|nr:16S rRNA (cytosine(967)-C(5))-methyltransferase [Clostridia bacterium]